MSAYSTHRTQTFIYLNSSACLCLLKMAVRYWRGSFSDSFCGLHYYASRLLQVTVVISESLNHSFKRFILRHWFIQEWSMYNFISFTQMIHSNHWFFSGTKQVAVCEWAITVNHSVNWFGQKYWFIHPYCVLLGDIWFCFYFVLLQQWNEWNVLCIALLLFMQLSMNIAMMLLV